jgi:ribosomal protein S18 acetylase RimI-like enzyme
VLYATPETLSIVSETNINFREFADRDLLSLARLRSTSEHEIAFWQDRILKYLAGTHNPQKALSERVIYVAECNDLVVGFIAGQLTTRFDCQGELQWINISPEFQRKKLASKLVQLLAHWFIQRDAYKVCVDPGTEVAEQFYAANGASKLNEHWMYWENIAQVVE